MIGILIEINGLHQLNKLDPGTGPEIQRQILAFLENRDLESYGARNCLYIQLPFSEEDNRKLWEGIREVYRYLFDRREEFQGFLILVDRTGISRPAEGFKKLRQRSIAIREQDALVITPRAEDYCRPYFDTVRKGAYLVLQSREKWMVPGSSGERAFYDRDRLVERIVQRLIPELGEQEPPGKFHFYGNDGIGKFHNIRESVMAVRGKAEGLPLPVVSGSPGLKADYQELMESLEKPFLEQVPELLTPRERFTWEARNFLLSQGVSDQGPEDFFLMYRLYLLAYIRACSSRTVPAHILCRNPELLGQESLEILKKIFRETREEGILVPVIISRESRLPEILEEDTWQRSRVTSLSLMEVESRLREAGLEEENTYEIRERTEGHVLYLFHYIMLMRNRIPVPPELKGREISLHLLKAMDLRLQKVLYAISLFPGMTDSAHWEEILEKNEIVHQDAREALRELGELGFLLPECWLKPSLEEVPEGTALSEQDQRQIQNAIARTGSRLWGDRQVFSAYSFLQGVYARGDHFDFARQFYDYTSLMLERGQTAKAEILLEVFQNLIPEGAQDPLSETVIRALGLRSALIQGDREMARVRFLAFKDSPEAPLTLAEALANLETARYQYALGEYRQALEAAKKALLFLQEEGNSLLEADANCQIGLIMMGMDRLDEAAMYFTLSREQLSPGTAPHNYIKTLALEGLCQIILGNYSQAGRLLDQAEEKSGAYGRRGWEIYTLFLQGRRSFELGRYDQAEEQFLRGLLLCQLYRNEERRKVFHAWIARSRIYQKRYAGALHLLGGLKPDGEVLFFTSEALFFLHRQERALEALELALRSLQTDVQEFFPGEYLSWSTGFTSVEDRAMRNREGSGVLLQQIRVFRGFLLGSGRDEEEGLQELSRITRDERICEEDPYNHFYYYLYNLVVPEMGDGESVNKLTILSRALKYLQQRASRIDETRDKQDYLNRNYWNSLLMEEGRVQRIL